MVAATPNSLQGNGLEDAQENGYATSSVGGASSVPAMMAPTDHPITKIPHILPRERVFPIQIGSELFKLSGASLSSDGEPK